MSGGWRRGPASDCKARALGSIYAGLWGAALRGVRGGPSRDASTWKLLAGAPGMACVRAGCFVRVLMCARLWTVDAVDGGVDGGA